MRILVSGATGFIGRHLVPRLIASGHEVLAGTRSLERYDGAGFATPLDVDDDDSVAAAMQGCGAAYFLVHSMSGDGYAGRDLGAAERFGDAAKANGTRVVYLGGLGREDEPKLSEHLRSRHEVGQALRDRCDAVELRASIVIGPGSTSFEMLRELVGRLPVMVTPRWVSTRTQPIALQDVLRYLEAGLTLPAGTYDVGGPDILTYRDMIERYAATLGKRRVIFSVPVLSPGLSSRWIRFVTSQDVTTAKALIESLSCEVVVVDHSIEALAPGPLLSYDEAVRVALEGDPEPATA